MAMAVPVFLWATALRAGLPAGLTLSFLDVGQGDAALVRSPGGATVLFDGGPDPELVATKLAALGVKRLDVVVATHPHLDHYVGLPAVLARFPVGMVLDSGCALPESASPPYRDFLHSVREEGIPERHPAAGDAFTVGDLTLDVVASAPQLLLKGERIDVFTEAAPELSVDLIEGSDDRERELFVQKSTRTSGRQCRSRRSTCVRPPVTTPATWPRRRTPRCSRPPIGRWRSAPSPPPGGRTHRRSRGASSRARPC